MSAETLTVTDNRTGRSYELPIRDGAVDAMALRQIRASDDDFGLVTYDPGLKNTAACRSAITYIDGEAGILRYRGYPVEQLAEQASFLEVAWLLLKGELPTRAELDGWTHEITHHTFIHENVKKFIDGFRYDAHPMGILVSTVAALSTFYPESKGGRAAAAPAAATYGSACEDPIVRIVVVEQFCSWSAWRMRRMSIARSSTGWGS